MLHPVCDQIISRITEILKDSTLIHRRLTQLRHPFEIPCQPWFRDRSFPHQRPKLGVLRNSMSPFSVNVSDRGLSVTRPGFPDRAGPASKGWQRDTGSSPWTPGCRGIGGREWTMTLSRPPWRGDHAPSPFVVLGSPGNFAHRATPELSIVFVFGRLGQRTLCPWRHKEYGGKGGRDACRRFFAPPTPFPLRDVELLGLFIRCQVQRALRVHPPLHFCWASDLVFFFFTPVFIDAGGGGFLGPLEFATRCAL